jgi:hypothetical protein
MDKALIDAGIELGNTQAIKIRLRELGYSARLLLKGPHDPIDFCCVKGGKGISCTHVWKTTPILALTEGCPHCATEQYCQNSDEPLEVTQEVLAAAIKAQHAKMKKSNDTALRRRSKSANNYGLNRYAI